MMKNNSNKNNKNLVKVKYPCNDCKREATCNSKAKICKQWKNWFSANWVLISANSTNENDDIANDNNKI